MFSFTHIFNPYKSQFARQKTMKITVSANKRHPVVFICFSSLLRFGGHSCTYQTYALLLAAVLEGSLERDWQAQCKSAWEIFEWASARPRYSYIESRPMRVAVMHDRLCGGPGQIVQVARLASLNQLPGWQMRFFWLIGTSPSKGPIQFLHQARRQIAHVPRLRQTSLKAFQHASWRVARYSCSNYSSWLFWFRGKSWRH